MSTRSVRSMRKGCTGAILEIAVCVALFSPFIGTTLPGILSMKGH